MSGVVEDGTTTTTATTFWHDLWAVVDAVQRPASEMGWAKAVESLCKLHSDEGSSPSAACWRWTPGMCLWRVTDLAHRHPEWLALAGGELLTDSLYVRVLSAAPELTAALWPELIEPLPFKVVQLGVLADLLTADTGNALGAALLGSLVLTAPVGKGDHHRAWAVARGRGRRYHRFVWDLLQATRDQLRSCAKAAHAHEPGATDTDGCLVSLLRLLVNLFVRGRDKKASVLTEGVLSDLAFLPRVSALLPLLLDREQATALRDHFERLDAAIAEWQARHSESFADVVAPPGKKQIAQRIDELLGLRKRRGAHEEHDDSEATVRGHLGAADGLQQLLHKAERGSTAALRQLVIDTDAAHSFGIARWLEAVVRARWLVPLVQIGELVYPLLTVLVRLHVELGCPSAPEADEMGTEELQQQIRQLYLDYFRELPQAQQAAARAFCYFNSGKQSPQDVAPLRNVDDEQSLLDAQPTAQCATTRPAAGRYLFNDPALVAEAEMQLTVKLNRLVPEHLDDKNYLSSVYEARTCATASMVSLVIPPRFVERIVGEGIANAKQAAVLCGLLHNTGLVARYRSHDSEDEMSLVGQVVDRYVGDIKTWRSGPEAERDLIAMLTLLLEPRAPVGDESRCADSDRADHSDGDASLDERVRVSLAQARTAIYDGTELLAWSLVPRIQQMAGDLRYGAPCTPELQDHLALLFDLVAAVLGGSDDYGGPERAYYDHTQCGLAPPEERYLARRLWVLEAYPWELLLALCQLLRQRPRFRAAVVARLIHVTERVAAFLALCLIARVRHPSLPGWRPGAQEVSGGGSSMGDFLSEIRDLEVDVLLRLRPLFAAAQPYQQEGGASLLYLPAQWLDDSDGLADWPTAPQSGEYTKEELLEGYARCLCYCRVSDRHCRLFLDWYAAEQAAQEYHHDGGGNDGDDGALLAYQLLAFAVVLSYSTAEEYSRLAHVLLPRMIEADLLRFQLPAALPLPLAATAVERAELGLLRGQVCALHLLLRMTVSLVLPRGGELAALYAAAAIDLPPELATTEGRRQVLHALDTHRDHLQWPTNFVRVVHGAVVLWEQKTKEVEQARQDWVAVGNAVLLGHALLVSVKLLCALQACTGPPEGDQRQVGILALDIAHRLNTALGSPPPPATAEASRALLLPLVSHSAALVLAGGRSHPDSENLLLQLKALMPANDHPPTTAG